MMSILEAYHSFPRKWELFWDEPYLFWVCVNVVIQGCIFEFEIMRILEAFHSSPIGGHHGGTPTTPMIL